MKIQSGLVFSRFKGRLVGFTDLGDISNELDDFNRLVKQGCKSTRPSIDHVSTLMDQRLLKYFN